MCASLDVLPVDASNDPAVAASAQPLLRRRHRVQSHFHRRTTSQRHRSMQNRARTGSLCHVPALRGYAGLAVFAAESPMMD